MSDVTVSSRRRLTSKSGEFLFLHTLEPFIHTVQNVYFSPKSRTLLEHNTNVKKILIVLIVQAEQR